MITVLLLVCNSYINRSTRFISLKLCMGFSIFDSVSFLLKFVFFSTKCMDSLTLERHNSLTNCLKPENQSFENISLATFE